MCALYVSIESSRVGSWVDNSKLYFCILGMCVCVCGRAGGLCSNTIVSSSICSRAPSRLFAGWCHFMWPTLPSAYKSINNFIAHVVWPQAPYEHESAANVYEFVFYLLLLTDACKCDTTMMMIMDYGIWMKCIYIYVEWIVIWRQRKILFAPSASMVR